MTDQLPDPERDDDGNYVDDHATICPTCAGQYGQWTGDPDSPVMPPGFDEHVASCAGRFHEWSPDGRGWSTPRPIFHEDGTPVTETSPVQTGEAWRWTP